MAHLRKSGQGNYRHFLLCGMSFLLPPLLAGDPDGDKHRANWPHKKRQRPPGEPEILWASEKQFLIAKTIADNSRAS